VITLFHISAFVGCLLGAIYGAASGHAHFGWWGVLLGIPGAYLGLVVGRLPRILGVIFLRQREGANSTLEK